MSNYFILSLAITFLSVLMLFNNRGLMVLTFRSMTKTRLILTLIGMVVGQSLAWSSTYQIYIAYGCIFQGICWMVFRFAMRPWYALYREFSTELLKAAAKPFKSNDELEAEMYQQADRQVQETW